MSCNISQNIKNHSIYIQSHFSCTDVFEGLILCKINLTRHYDLCLHCYLEEEEDLYGRYDGGHLHNYIYHQKSPSHTSVFFAPLS